MKGVEWMNRAACSGGRVDLWMQEPGNRASEAIRICRTCPVQTECLEYALATASQCFEGTGIWGGLTPKERRAIRKRRQRLGAA